MDSIKARSSERRRRPTGRSAIRMARYGGSAVGRTALLAVTEAAFESNRSRSIEAARCVLQDLDPVTGHIERNNGLMEDFRSLHVLRETHCPAILVEMDFLSNRTSERKLNTSAYRSAIARAISEAIMTYLSESEEGTAP